MNIFSVDLEEWYNGNYLSLGNTRKSTNTVYRVEQNTEILLSLLKQYQYKATFFVLGEIAQQFPSLIQKIYQQGHEIASHSYTHDLIYNRSKDEFWKDIMKSKELLESIIGDEVLGFRAPSWSITEQSTWAWELLEKAGFRYSSSVFPVKNYLYGLPKSPRVPYHPVCNHQELSLLEIPCSTVKVIGKNMPFSGGFYLRALPYPIIQKGIDILQKEEQPAIIYVHPWELDKELPKLDINFKETIIRNWGISSCESKLHLLCKNNKFTSIKEYYFENLSFQ